MASGSLGFTTFIGIDGVEYIGQAPWNNYVLQNFFGFGPEAYWVDGKGWVKVQGNVDPLTPKDPPVRSTVTDGPRLGDLSVTSSAYGNPIAIGYGTVRMQGNIIWSPGLQERSIREVTQQASETTGQQITKNYLYSASFAVAFGEGPCSDVLRIWANGLLIFDKRDIESQSRRAGLVFRLHKGTATQKRDPLILGIEQIDYTPAFRDTVYLVFEDLQLADFGNTIPHIEAEISYNTDSTRPQQISGSALSTSLNTFTSDTIGVDWNRGYAYYMTSSSNPFTNGISRVNMNTVLKDREVTGAVALDQSSAQGTTNFSSLGNMAVMPDGAIVASVSIANPIASNSAPIVRLDPSTLKETARFGTGGTAVSMEGPSELVPDGRFGWGQLITYVSAVASRSVSNYALIATGFGSVGVLSLPDLQYVWDSDTELGGFASSKILAMCPGENGEAWILTGPDYSAPSTDNVELYRLAVGTSGNVTVDLIKTFAPASLAGGSTSLGKAGPMVFDMADPSIMIFAEGASGGDAIISKFDVSEDRIVWQTEDLNISPQNHHWEASNVTDATFGFIVGSNGILIDTLSGDVTHNQVAPDWAIAEDGNGSGAYDSRTESFVSLIVDVSGKPMGRFYFNRGPGNGEGLDVIAKDLCSRVGLTADDVDATDVASIIVPGYSILDHITVRQALEELNTVYGVDAFESDFKLKFIERGGDPVRTLTEDDLAVVTSVKGDIISEERTQEIELPVRFTFQYQDKTNDYIQSAHSVGRAVFPDRSMFSDNHLRVELEVALHPDVAKQQAEKMMYGAWAGRNSYSFSLSWGQLDLDPSDVINVVLDNGTSYRMRATNHNVGSDMTIQLRAVSEKEAQYVSIAVAGAGTGVPTQSVSAFTTIQTFVLDVPLLRDNDEVADRVSNPTYFFMGGFAEGGFERGTLYSSTDGIAYNVVGDEIRAMDWGTVVDVLGDPKNNNPFITDDVNSITVIMNTGASSLFTITEAQFLLDINVAAILKDNGEVEIINYKTVTDNGDSSYTLSGFIRGRRGSEAMAYDHTAGETIVLLTQVGFGEVFQAALSSLDTLVDYAGVGSRQFFEQGQRIELTSNHRALMPYAPGAIAAVEDGSSNIDISWERRTRLGGDWRDLTATVPLNEDTEEYEIDILVGVGGAVLRTITGLTTNSYEYTNADILTDFGAFPDQLTFNVYQISAQVGRGFTNEATIVFTNADVDPDFASVVLLSSFDGVDGATSATDDSDSSHTFVFSNGAQIDTAQKKFGLSSVLLDGVDDTLHVADSVDFDFDTDPFTIEGWYRWNTIQGSYNGLMGQWQAGVAEKWLLRWDTAGTLELRIDATSNPVLTIASGAWTPTLGVWYHLAADRDASNTFRIYAGGAVIGSGVSTYDISLGGSPQMSIGHYQGTNELDGWVDEIRITKGVARYAGAFTPRTARFPRTA